MALAVQRGYCLPRDTTPVLCSVFCCLPALHRFLARCAFPGETDAAKTINPGSKGCTAYTFCPYCGLTAAGGRAACRALCRGAWRRHLSASLAQSAVPVKGDAGYSASSLAVRAASDDARDGRRVRVKVLMCRYRSGAYGAGLGGYERSAGNRACRRGLMMH